jgi:signal-transduction protein with cAMP-binding, CBS, and nucleotidyltransferase domain
MKVREIMHNFLELDYATSVTDAAQKMEEVHTGSALIKKKEKIVGIFTERDIMKKIVAKGKDIRRTMIGEIMSSPIITIDIDADVVEATELMNMRKIRRLAVVQEGKIVGKITANTISRNFKYLLGKGIYSREQFPQYERPIY